MKRSKLLLIILCVILSLCAALCFGACADDTPSDPDNSKPSIVQPEKDPDTDPDKTPDEEPGKEPDVPDEEPGNEPEEPDYGKFDGNDFLRTSGTYVKNKKGDTVFLRGANAGGLFVTENWMTGFKGSAKDYKSLTETFIERFGETQTQDLWAQYRANWWTDKDFENCAEMGMTVIRLPFTYMNVDFAAVTSYDNAGKNYDFSALDDFVTKAAQYGMYTILDLHGAYGSQNGQDHSGESMSGVDDVDFYSNEKMQTLTVNLWSALSEHYKDNPAVAGYDILNEPGEKGGSTSERHWNFYDKVYKAIRANGDEHIVMFESCWEWYNLPKPSQYGWTNCIYSFHHYVGDQPSVDEHVSNWQGKLSGIANQNFGVPLQMGEFTAYDSTEKWERTLDMLNSREWHWTSWTYKVWGNMPWGIVNVIGNDSKRVDAANDSYDEIIAKFGGLRTEDAQKYKFGDSQRTLENILKESLTGVKEIYVTVNKVGLTEENGKAYAVFGGKCGINTIEDLSSYVIDHEISGRVKFDLEVTEYNEESGTFAMKTEITSLAVGRHYLHAGFDAAPGNLSSAVAKIDGENSSITVGNKTYSLDEQWSCRQIVVGEKA